MSVLTKAEALAAVAKIKKDSTPDDRRMMMRLPPNERDTILLLAALLDASPVTENGDG